MDKMDFNKGFEESIRQIKKIIRDNNIPDCEEIEEMELLKDKNGDYADNITAQMFLCYLNGYEDATTILFMETAK